MELIGDIARKAGDADLLRVEAEKSRRAGRIGEDSGLFRVPKILGFDEDAGILDCERIQGLIHYHDLVARQDTQCEPMAERVGRALARVHLDLSLDASMRSPLPPAWRGGPEDEVFIHGDFTANNVCVDPETMELVIVDWSAAPLVGRQGTVGSRCFDVICFVAHLHMSAPWARTLTWPAGSLCRLVMEAYVEAYGAPLDPDTWIRHRRELDEFSTRRVSGRVGSAPLLVRPGKAAAQHWLKRSWRNFQPPHESLAHAAPS